MAPRQIPALRPVPQRDPQPRFNERLMAKKIDKGTRVILATAAVVLGLAAGIVIVEIGRAHV